MGLGEVNEIEGVAFRREKSTRMSLFYCTTGNVH